MQGLLARLGKLFGWLLALAFWPAVLGWLGLWLLPKWFDIPEQVSEVIAVVTAISTAAAIIGLVVAFGCLFFGWLFFGGGTSFVDEKGRPYPDSVIEAIKLAEAAGEKVTESRLREIISEQLAATKKRKGKPKT
jgi:hypothetical protein